jgi:ferrous iron transport protein B
MSVPTVAPLTATSSASPQTLTVALIGNPNTGKSTLFSALSGYQAVTGNYPGVTVEKKIGRMKIGERPVQLIDLPGTYSIAPRTLDEMVTVDVLLGRLPDVPAPDVVVCIVDASNIERNLYVVSQVLDMGLPLVLVLNMIDVAESRGVKVDLAALSQKLGHPVLTTQAHRRQGIDEVRQAILKAAEQGPAQRPRVFPPEFVAECQKLRTHLSERGHAESSDFLLERLLLDVGGYLEGHFTHRDPQELVRYLAEARQRLAGQGCKVPAVEARVRYKWARELLTGVITQPATRAVTASDKIDRVLTHRFAGFLIFIALMFVIFQAIYTGAKPLMDACKAAQGWLGEQVAAVIAPGPLQSLLVDGVIAGVGGVLVFLPQIAILFLFIALLEDCGYMARAAFLMDKLMTKVGLSGKSFVPLMSSFACAIPGIMATRVIENRRDRMTTILVAPLMSCSARQPVYFLMISAFVPMITYARGWIGLQGLVMFAMTFLGAAVAIPIAWLLKKTFFRGETPPFVMELPSYKWPSPRIVLLRVYDRSRAFVVRAGTLIFASSILVWAASYFPSDHREELRVEKAIQAETERIAPEVDGIKMRIGFLPLEAQKIGLNAPTIKARQKILEKQLAEVQGPLEALQSEKNALSQQALEKSYLGRLGKAIEPAVRPLGWDWKIGVGALSSFPAREVIIGTLGTIYSLGKDVSAEDTGLQGAVQGATWPDGRKVYNLPVAVSIMVFFALCAQCASTLMVIRRETNSWIWPAFTFTYMTALAYVGAWVAYRVGMSLFGT